jgi:pimeloyl-ACP methyl ester carboxylesterase
MTTDDRTDTAPTTPARSTRLVDVGGVDLAVWETGEGEPVVFLHGVLLSGELWTPTIAALAPTRRYITIDLPGHGDSPVAANLDPSIPRFAELLPGVLEQLQIDRAHIVANDSGGAIAQRFAVAHPHRVATLTLTNCDTEGNIPPVAFEPAVELAQRSDFGKVLRVMHADLAFARSASGLGGSLQRAEDIPDVVIRGFLEPLLASPAATASVERLIASFQPSDLSGVTAALAALGLPTLLAWGTDDVFFATSFGRELAAALGESATLVEIDGGRLFWPLERPTELTALVGDFWAAHPTARS